MMQQFLQGFLPISFNGTWAKNSERQLAAGHKERRNLQMHNFDDFYIPFSRLTSFDKLTLISFPKLWNAFDNHEIKLIRNKLQFNSLLKSFFLDQLKERVSCDCLLCQACNPFRV